MISLHTKNTEVQKRTKTIQKYNEDISSGGYIYLYIYIFIQYMMRQERQKTKRQETGKVQNDKKRNEKNTPRHTAVVVEGALYVF